MLRLLASGILQYATCEEVVYLLPLDGPYPWLFGYYWGHFHLLEARQDLEIEQ